MSKSSGAASGGVYRYYVLIMLMLTFMFNITDRMVMSILIEDIKADFTLSDTQIGLLAGTAFTIFYVILGIPAGRLADRTNRKNMVAIAVALWSVMAALCGVAIGFWTLFLARLGVGIGEAGGSPPSVSLITNYFESHELSKAMGIFSVGAVLGPVLGFVAGGLLAEAYGWRWTFIILGLPGVLVGVIIFFTIKEPKRGQIATRETQSTQVTEQEPFMVTMRSLWQNKLFTRVVISQMLAVTASYAFAIWLAPILIRNYEVPVSQIGIYLGIVWVLGGVPGMVLGGFLTDRLSAKNPKWRAWFCSIVLLLSLPLLCLCLLTDNLMWALVLYTFGYGLHSSTQGPAIAMMQSSVAPAERGTASAVGSLATTFLGYFLGPAVVGAISDSLAADHGTLSLNYAVIAITIISIIPAIITYLWASRAIKPLKVNT